MGNTLCCILYEAAQRTTYLRQWLEVKHERLRAHVL